MWCDKKFTSLSKAQPCGQALWFFLLTGPHTGPIPGLFRAGRASMAEDLDWEQEGFDKAFLEVLNQGMAKADFTSKLVWLPNALKLNKPESPNVVRSWAQEWELLPECDLKNEAHQYIINQLADFGEPFVNAFLETIGKPSGKPSGKTCPNQEQEQEQEQEKAFCTEPSLDAGDTQEIKKPDVIIPSQDDGNAKATAQDADIVVIELPLNDKTLFAINRNRYLSWVELYPAVDVLQELRKMRGWLDACPSRRKTKGGILKFANGWLAKEQDNPKQKSQSAPGKVNGCGYPVTRGDYDRNSAISEAEWRSTDF